MKNLSIFILGLLCYHPVFSQNADHNFGFEKANGGYAHGWTMGIQGDYKLGLDTVVKHSGKQSLLIEKITDTHRTPYAMAGYFIPAKYEGKEIELTFFVKLEGVKNHIDCPFRIDGQDYDRLQFTNLLKNRIYGTSDWTKYRLQLPLPQNAEKILFWPALNGPGKLWIDDVEILIDGKPLDSATLKKNFKPIEPIWFGGNDAASGKVNVQNGTLYYEIYGSGTPLVLLHGNSQSINVFKKQIREFSKSYQVIAVDTRGQGKSADLSSEPLTYDLFAEDLKTLLDSLHIKKAHIIGWSDGGNTGLIMSHKYPSYVDKLAVMGACTNPNEAVSAKTLDEVKKALKLLAGKSDDASKKQSRLLTMLLTEPHIHTEDLHRIKSKVLVMAGESDMILPAHTKYIAENIPQAKQLLFKGAGHYAPVEIPLIFNEAVLGFLQNE